MNRVTLPGALLFATLGVTGAMGCQLIVGSGDYAVGSGEISTPDGSGGSGDDGPFGTTDDSAAVPDQAAGDAGAHIGDPCSANAQCPHGSTCEGLWCTEPCGSSAACGESSAGQPNLCLSNGVGGGKSCVPGCQTNDDCSSYAGTTCVQATATASYCAVSADAATNGSVGDPCTSSSDCTPPANCNNDTWCSASCTSSSDTSCGSNSLGQENHCVEDSNNDYICFPGCTTNADCLSYSGTTCQLIQSGSTSVYICAGTKGSVGDPCDSTGDIWATCAAPDGGVAPNCNNGIWCTIDCTTDTSCGTNTAGQASYCVQASGGTNICFPGCVQYADCATYTGTFCQQIYGSTRGFVCAATGGELGDPCATDADCTAGSCAVGWCTQSCQSASDTSCGMNSEGNTNYCVFDSTAGAYQCDPGCTVGTDCLPYAGASCQSVSGQSSTVCSF
jgi:hypothetical protein